MKLNADIGQAERRYEAIKPDSRADRTYITGFNRQRIQNQPADILNDKAARKAKQNLMTSQKVHPDFGFLLDHQNFNG